MAFQNTSAKEALNWLMSDASGAAKLRFEEFLNEHGHRSIKELCVREKGWIDALKN